MSILTSYNGLQVVSPTPTGSGGLAINNNFKALSTQVSAVNPTSGNDSSQGFAVGSRWYNSSTTVEWICLGNTAGAAVWTAINSGLQPWQTATLINSWAKAGPPYAVAGYRLDRGVVRLRGLVTGGAVGSTLFVLASGYPPAATVILPVSNCSYATGGLVIDTSGNVTLAWGSGSWCSLEGVSFSVN
jgi:hypothetical protein